MCVSGTSLDSDCVVSMRDDEGARPTLVKVMAFLGHPPKCQVNPNDDFLTTLFCTVRKSILIEKLNAISTMFE